MARLLLISVVQKSEVMELAREALKVDERVKDAPVEQIKALFRTGITTDLIARSLGVDADLVNTIIIGDQELLCANGVITFTPAELATVKMRLLQAVVSGSENVSAKVSMWIGDKHMVNADTKLRIEKGIGMNNAIAINIQNVLTEAASKAAKHVSHNG